MEKINRGIEKSRYKWTVQVGNQWPRDLQEQKGRTKHI